MSDSRPKVLVLSSPNQSRLAHFRKLHQLKCEYQIAGVCVGNSLGWEHRYVDSWTEIPSEVRGLQNLVEKITHQVVRPDAVINLSEAYVPLHAALCSHYGLIGPDQEMVQIGRDKYKMRRFLDEIDLPGPRYQLFTGNTNEGCDVSFPVVLKPVIGCSSSFVERFDSETNLRTRFPTIQSRATDFYRSELLTNETIRSYGTFPFILEEMMGGEILYETRFPYEIGEFSVESIYNGRNCYTLAIHDSPIASNGPVYEKVMNSTPTRVPGSLAELAHRYVSRIHEALGRGCYVLHTEMRTFPDSLRVVEFGIRVGGSSLYKSVEISTGNDFVQLLIKLALGEETSLESRPPKPTIIHYLCAPRPGVITAYRGESALQSFPTYVEHQLYDEVGQCIARPPENTRACGYVAVRGESFDLLEADVLAMLNAFSIDVAQ